MPLLQSHPRQHHRRDHSRLIAGRGIEEGRKEGGIFPHAENNALRRSGTTLAEGVNDFRFTTGLTRPLLPSPHVHFTS
jgi:hypothetical protein